jgi:hypothetical protein
VKAIERNGFRMYDPAMGARGSNICGEADNEDGFPDREPPRDPSGIAFPDPEAPCTQLDRQEGRHGNYGQACEFDANRIQSAISTSRITAVFVVIRVRNLPG